MKRVRERMTDKEWADFYHTLEILSDEMKEDIPMEVKEPAI